MNSSPPFVVTLPTGCLSIFFKAQHYSVRLVSSCAFPLWFLVQELFEITNIEKYPSKTNPIKWSVQAFNYFHLIDVSVPLWTFNYYLNLINISKHPSIPYSPKTVYYLYVCLIQISLITLFSTFTISDEIFNFLK